MLLILSRNYNIIVPELYLKKFAAEPTSLAKNTYNK